MHHGGTENTEKYFPERLLQRGANEREFQTEYHMPDRDLDHNHTLASLDIRFVAVPESFTPITESETGAPQSFYV